MKKKIIFLISLFLLLYNISQAQEQKVYYLDSIFAKNGMAKIAEKIYDNGWIHFRTDLKIDPLTIFTKYKSYFGLGEDDQMILSDFHEKKQKGKMVYEYQQYYKFLPVKGAKFIIHSNNGIAYRGSGDIIPGLSLNVLPTIKKQDAINVCLKKMNSLEYAWENEYIESKKKEKALDPNATYYPDPKPCIVRRKGYLPKKSEYYVAAYEIDITSVRPDNSISYFVEINSNEIVNSKTRIIKDLCPGSSETSTGNETLYNGDQTIYTKEGLINYTLYDDTRDIETQSSLIGIIKDGDNNWDDSEDLVGVSAHWAAIEVFDYFNDTWGRKGLDNSCHNLEILVDYNFGYCQASYNSSTDVIKIGRSVTSECSSMASLDVVAHENTHGYVNHLSSLNYEYESGALNESFADIFSIIIQNEVEGYNFNRLWFHGEDPFDGFTGGRSFSDPSTDGNPEEYEGTNWFDFSNCTPPDDDYCGVHTNSLVQTYWFYLLVEGDATLGVTGIGFNDAAKIVYNVLADDMTDESEFVDSRNASILYAEEEWGLCSNQCIQVMNAWEAVDLTSGYKVERDANCTTIGNDHALSLPHSSTAIISYTIDCDLLDNQSTTIRAGTEVIMDEGFDSGDGTDVYFVAEIIDCPATGGTKSNYIKYRIPEESTVVENLSSENESDIELNETASFSEIKVFPNPNHGSFTIHLSDYTINEQTMIKLFDLTGKLVYKNTFDSESIEIDISEKEAGMYILEITNNENKHISKILKK